MFYGWKLAAIGSCGNLLLQGSVFYTMNAFIEPLVELHGWSRAGIGLSMTFASAMMTLSMPIGIMLTNKISIRLLMTLGAFIGGLSYVGLGYVDDIRLFAALFRHRMGVRAGSAAGGRHHAYEPLVRRLPGPCFRAGQHGDFPVRGVPAVRGPRTGGYAGRFMGVFDTRRPRLPAFPLCWRIIRNTPEDIGLAVDGVAANPFAAAREEEKVIPMNWRELVASRQMWIIGVSFGIGLMAVGACSASSSPALWIPA